MKITKRQLRRIIKEERAKLMNEAPRTDGRGNKAANYAMVKDAIYTVIDKMDGLDRIELEELRDHRDGHWTSEFVQKMADIVLLSRMDSAYMGG